MSNLITLLKVNFINSIGINKILKEKSKSEKNKILGTSLLIFMSFAMLFCMFTVYAMSLGKVLKEISKVDVLLTFAITMSTVFVFFTSIYKAQGYLFSNKDYDILAAMPIKSSTILLSKILSLIIINYCISLIMLLPFAISYFINSNVSFIFFIYVIVLSVFVPLIPIVLASIIAFIISFFSSRSKHKNIVAIVLSVLSLVLIMVLSMRSDKIIEYVMENSNAISIVMQKMYLPSYYFTEALKNFSIINGIKFILISIVPFIVFILVFSRSFKTINSKLKESYKKSNYKFRELKVESPVKALLRKEVRRYFSSNIYVLNTSVGMILFTIFSVALIFVGVEKISVILEMPMMAEILPSYIILIGSGLVALTCTTAPSISLESPNLWILKSMPIKETDIFKSKIALNLLVILPLLYINMLVLSFKFRISGVYLIGVFLIPTLYAFIISMGGLLINLYFPKLMWTSETQVVKQSASTMISMLFGMVIIAIPTLIYIYFRIENFAVFIGVLAVILLSVIFVIWNMLKTKGVELFNKL